MAPEQEDLSMLQLNTSLTKVETTLEHMSNDMTAMRIDVKQLREGAPLHRIETLEGRWRAVTGWLAALTLVVIGAIVTALLTR